MMCEAIWGNKGPKNQIATLPGIRKGVVEPYVRRAMQMVTNWNLLASEEWVQEQEVETYWNIIKRTRGMSRDQYIRWGNYSRSSK